jgi:hypothetical protein
MDERCRCGCKDHFFAQFCSQCYREHAESALAAERQRIVEGLNKIQRSFHVENIDGKDVCVDYVPLADAIRIVEDPK